MALPYICKIIGHFMMNRDMSCRRTCDEDNQPAKKRIIPITDAGDAVKSSDSTKRRVYSFGAKPGCLGYDRRTIGIKCIGKNLRPYLFVTFYFS